MKKYLFFLVLFFGNFSVHSEGVKLNCTPAQKPCFNCPEFQTLFPVQKFNNEAGSLDVEANESEAQNETYHLIGDVKVKSEGFALLADDVIVTSASESIVGTGNVKFQDKTFLVTTDLLKAKKNEDDELIVNATDATYQNYSAGLKGGNGYAEIISKSPTSIFLTNSTYSLCPIDNNDWLMDAKEIELNLDKNRGIARNATLVFYGVPIFYSPRYSWVIEGRGSGFLTPTFNRYREKDETKVDYLLRVPYYFNISPDQDLVVALSQMTSRGVIYEGSYRKLIAPKITEEKEDSLYQIEIQFLPSDKISSLNRWLINFEEELDFNSKTHLSAQFNRVSDPKYFEEIAQSNTSVGLLNSHLKLTHDDMENSNLLMEVLSESKQVVNKGGEIYTRAFEGSFYKKFNANPAMPITLKLLGTKFSHKWASKVTGSRLHGDLEISRKLKIGFPKITPRANLALTNYSLKNKPNVKRTIFGSGVDFDFTVKSKTNLFDTELNHRISPIISYNYRPKVAQKDIPIFDTKDKNDSILTFGGITSGDRYKGLDRTSNANDITLSLESSYRGVYDNPEFDDDSSPEYVEDLLNMRIAQSYYSDKEVVSDELDTNYETRKSYSDIAASIDLAIGKYKVSSNFQYNPNSSKIVKKQNTLSYAPTPRKFISLVIDDLGTSKAEGFYGAYPLTDKIHIFGGFNNSTDTLLGEVTKSETTGIAYESCCWAFRLAHFKKAYPNGDSSYSTGAELVLVGLGSTASPLRGRIEKNVLGYELGL